MRKRFYNMKNEEWKAISKQDMACKNTLNFVFVVVEASRIIFLNFTVTIFFPGFNGKENPSTVQSGFFRAQQGYYLCEIKPLNQCPTTPDQLEISINPLPRSGACPCSIGQEVGLYRETDHSHLRPTQNHQLTPQTACLWTVGENQSTQREHSKTLQKMEMWYVVSGKLKIFKCTKQKQTICFQEDFWCKFTYNQLSKA